MSGGVVTETQRTSTASDMSAFPEAVMVLRSSPEFVARFTSDNDVVRRGAMAEMEKAFKSGQAPDAPANPGLSPQDAPGDAPAPEVVSDRSEFDMSTFGPDADPAAAAEVIAAARDAGLPGSLFNAAAEMVNNTGADFVPDAAMIEKNYAACKASMGDDFKLGAAYLKQLDAANPIFGEALDRLLSNESTARWVFGQAALLAAQRR
ncbi:MAG: hypothetical protein GEU91_20025 [Rhizobiales bacterium]|nr:hypothetical protein [Hyphomicrobiales bacterium]